MSRFLRFCAFLSVLFLTSNVFAAGYTCPTAKKYTSCAANYYVSDCGTTYDGRTLASSSLTSGNSCNSCPSGYTCSGGLVCPRSATVTVTFQTGSTRLGTQTFTSGTAKNLTALTSLPNYTAPVSSTYGWTFAGWASSVGTTTIAHTDAASATFAADTTLYAVWKRTITAKYIGTATATTISTGSPVQYYRNTSTTAAAPNAITFPALVESTRYGWKPIGWSHDGTASASVPDTTITQHAMQLKPTEKNVYYAVYERALTQTYAGNGSTSGSTASHSIDQWFNAGSGTLSNNTRLIAAANGFTRTNYWFNGWNTKGDGSGIAYDEGASVTLPTTWNTAQSMTLYAQWGANITCDAGKYLPKNTTTCASCPAGYYCEGGTFPRNTVDQGLTGVCASGYSTGGAATSECTACASGYAASGTAYTDHDEIGDCKRTITLNKNGGSGTIQGASGTTSATITCSQGSACDFGSASGLSQTCYTFTGGWGTSASCTATTTSFTTPTSSTYYACKNQKDVTVTFVGTNTIGQQTFKCGTAQNLTAAADMPAPVEDNGWTFAGWSTAQDGTPELADQASFAPQADTTLYGVWSRPVTFKYYDGATATGVTTAQRTQYFYGGSPTSVSTYALATQSSYSWAPVGWVLNSTSGTTTASTATTTAANVTPSPTAAANYYALYKRTATVAYNGNTNTGGSTSSTTGTQYFNAGSSAANALALVLATNGFTKTGYSFSKWASGSTSGTQYVVGAKFTFPNTAWSGSSTHTMYATWTANTYTVAYDANGGSGTTASSSHTYGTSKALTANGFTNGVKKFLGWSTSSTATSATYTNKQSVSNLTTTNGATVTLYAVWGTCTACSAGTGATCSLSAPLGVCTYTTSCLDGYNTISNSGAYNPSCKANTYTVAYDANGGSGTTASSSHTYGTSKALTANGFTNGVKKFLGWSTSSTATSATYTNKQSVSNLTTTNGATVTLYAVWGTCTACKAGIGATCSLSAPLGVCTYTTSCLDGYNTISNSGAYNPSCKANTYTVAYNSNKPSGASGSISGSTANSSHTYATAKALTTNGYSLTGWTFAGWNTKADGSGTSYTNGQSVSNLTTTNGATVTLYAKWTANTYTVTFNTNSATSGSPSKSSVTCTYDSACSAATQGTMLKTNSVFGGWNVNTSGTGTNYASGGSIKNISTGNAVTLYAKWTTCTACSAGTGATCSLSVSNNTCTYTTSCKTGYNTISNSGAYNPSCKANTYTVAYDANGGSGTTASSSHTYGTSKALTANGFTNGVKKFLGWSTSSTATSATYTNKQSVSNLTTTNGGTVTLYAVWGTCTACSAGTGATCSLSAPLGVCTYTTSCKTGYNTISNSGAYNPVCAANAIPIGLNKNGGSGTCLEVPEGATAGLECTYDSDCILPSWNSTTCNIANGYNVFTGWNTAADGSGTTYAPGANVKNITSGDAIMLYAMWSETQCNVTNGVYVKQNTTNNKPTCKVTCNTGYQTSGTYQGTAGTTTVTYACTAIKSTVSFDANGGTGGQSAAVTATYGSAMPTISTTKPTRTGYTFMGWYDNATYTSGTQYYTAAGASARSWNKTAATTLYAGWKPNEYTITLDADGVVTSGTLYTKYNTGVYTDSARTTAMSTTANGIASTLLPPKTATVTLNANGGSVSQTSAGVTLTCRGYYSAVSGGTQYIGAAGKITTDGLTAGKGYTANKTWYAQWIPGSYALPTPTRTGYTFNGWATSSSATSGATGSYSVTGDVTLYATWTANLTGAIDLLSRAYSSTSDTTGMSLTTSAMPTPVYIRYNTGVYTSTATSATAITKLTTMPALTGYTFQGFYTGKAGTGTQVIDASGNFTSAVKTLYPTAGQVAEWYPHFTANCNQVVLNANGGTAGTTATLYRRTNETKFYTNSACTTTTAQSAILPTRDGYKFRGFYTLNMADVSADTAESTDVRIIGSLGGQTTVGDSWKITGAETLYAAWAKNCAAGTKATCSLSVGDGVDYATGCDTGYNFKSGANTYAPVCQANTYSVTYNPRASRLGGGSWAASVREYTYDTEYFLPTAGEFWGSYMPLGSYVEYEGKRFTFLGWTRDISSDVTDTDLDILNTGTKKAWNLTAENGGTVNLYAVWSECAICMPGLGATCYLTDTTTCQYETACKTGFKNLTNSGTYNPRCEPIEYTVRYASNCDGATGTMANVAFDYTDVFNPSTNGYTCGTKKFLGWANTANCDLTLEDGAICTEVDYEPGEEYDALTETDGDQVILLAVWGECTACLNNTPGASCTLSAPKGVCTYTTACLLGYHGLNNGGTNFPSCSANTYTVKYDMNCPSGVTCSSAPSSTACTYDQRCTFSSISSTSLYAGGYKLLGWASTTTGTPTTNGINLAVADAEVVTRYAIWESCTSGYYHPAATGTAANVCTAAADGKFVAGNAATAAVSCATGSYSEKSSASTKCVACPAGRTTAGTGTKYNATANTACATTCSNATGVYTWATPSWSNNTVANLCTVTSCSSKYYLNSATTNKACALCSDLADTNGFYPNSDNGNNTSAAACYTNSLSGQYVKSSGDAAATDCPNWTYKGAHSVRFGTVSTCDSCLTVPSAVNNVAWTKASGTKWTSYSQCVVTQTPANCASGSVKRTQTDASTWGSTTLASTLKSKAGYYAGTSALACTICPSGSYCPASATTATKCATGSYSSTNGASVCVACQDGTTTSGTGQTSCNATCSNATGVSDWETASWTTSNTVTSLCTIAATAGCSADYYKNSNACATCSSGTSGKYTKSAAGTTSVNSCYLVTTAGKYVATKGAGETACISPYYCKGGTTVYYGTGTTTGGHTACSGLGSIYTKSDASASAATQCYATTTPGKYVTAKATAEATCPAGDWCEGSVKVYYGSAGGNTDCPSGYTNGTTGYSAQSQCLMNVAGGKYVATEKESSASGTCAKGYAKAAHTVNYGSTSSCSACTGATYAASTGQTSCTACPTATNNASKATGYSYWNAGTTADHTTVAGCYVTYENEPLDDGNMSLYYCYADTDAATTGEYGVDGTSKGCWVYWDKLTCDGGYYNKNYSTSSNYDFTNKTIANLKANACIAVGAGNWSANDALTRTACTSPLTTIGYGTAANEEADCGRKLHMGSNVVYLRSDKRTTPSLRVKVDGTTFYGALSTSLSSAMKVKNGSTTYSVVNDYQ